MARWTRCTGCGNLTLAQVLCRRISSEGYKIVKNSETFTCADCGVSVASHYDGVKVGADVLCMPCFIATKPRCETCGDRLSERGDISLGYVVDCIACVSRADTARRMSYHQQSDCNDCTAALNEDGTCPVCDATDDSNSEGTDSMHLPTFVYVPTAVVYDGDGEERPHAEGTVYFTLEAARRHTRTGWPCSGNDVCTPCVDAEVVSHNELIARTGNYRAHTTADYYGATWYVVMHAVGDSHDDSTCATGTAEDTDDTSPVGGTCADCGSGITRADMHLGYFTQCTGCAHHYASEPCPVCGTERENSRSVIAGACCGCRDEFNASTCGICDGPKTDRAHDLCDTCRAQMEQPTQPVSVVVPFRVLNGIL